MADFLRVENIIYVLFFITVYDASLRELLLTKIILPIDLYSNRKENKKDRLRSSHHYGLCISEKDGCYLHDNYDTISILL